MSPRSQVASTEAVPPVAPAAVVLDVPELHVQVIDAAPAGQEPHMEVQIQVGGRHHPI